MKRSPAAQKLFMELVPAAAQLSRIGIRSLGFGSSGLFHPGSLRWSYRHISTVFSRLVLKNSCHRL
jgi:hypothetical protein